MKVSSAWIKNWLGRTMLSGPDVASALERAGLEVESVEVSADIDKRVVVALVKKVVQHPQADRLKIATVYDGTKDFVVVCGAPNVREGLKVAFSQIGAVLPGGDRIAAAKLRGVVSEGMLCSEQELGLGRDHGGIIELEESAEIGLPVRELFPADAVIDLTTPANRADVLSVVGLAREVAAMSKAELKSLEVPKLPKNGADPAVKAGAEARRYMLARIRVDNSGKSARVAAARLRAAGMRPLSPVVDVTNFVMLELGQPLHAFDSAKVKLPVTVRRARSGEKLTTLDGVKRALVKEDLVIADATGPIALAGLMGGEATEVGPETREILLESAVFDGVVVRKMAQRHGIRTEASARFERGLPVELPPLAMGRAAELLRETAGGKLVAVSDQLNARPTRRKIVLTMARLERVLGFGITHEEAAEALERLQIKVGESSKDKIVVPEAPWWRPDLALPEDLSEEVVRVIGYDRVPSTLPPWRAERLVFDRERAKRRLVRDVMYGCGLFEVATYSFVSEEQLRQAGEQPGKQLKLKNPMSREQAYMRSSLLASHLAVLASNRRYSDDLGFYEVSGVFVPRGSGEQPDEPLRLAVMMRRDSDSYRYAKGVLDALARELNVNLSVEPGSAGWAAPGRAGKVKLGAKVVGTIGQILPVRLREQKIDGEATYFELDLAPVLAAAGPRQFAGVHRFPVIVRDVSVMVPAAVTWAQLAEAAAEPVEFVGDYSGPGLPAGHKAVTVRLTVALPDRTPTEDEAATHESQLVSRLARKLGARRRD